MPRKHNVQRANPLHNAVHAYWCNAKNNVAGSINTQLIFMLKKKKKQKTKNKKSVTPKDVMSLFWPMQSSDIHGVHKHTCW